MTIQNIIIVVLFFVAFMTGYFALVNYYSLEEYMSTEHTVVSREREIFDSETISAYNYISFHLYPKKQLDTDNLFVNYSITELPSTIIKQVQDKKLDTIAKNDHFQVGWERDYDKDYEFNIDIYDTSNEITHKEKITFEFLSKKGTETITSESYDKKN
ncbi:hypothetical protein [Candidatus Absconditicoccus praedator]|uniref:hypothetical protein n=1 Tax=Candidatus Absconditicoccus praedator TaxID=2735562 RepID=UPI001E5D768B|nr:hypothetical protein [Candidatus Absconditicoccus praedator]UFX82720.1 hypothetical protein HLG78_01030 [Candidatus Absconditicoccus praedator]